MACASGSLAAASFDAAASAGAAVSSARVSASMASTFVAAAVVVVDAGALGGDDGADVDVAVRFGDVFDREKTPMTTGAV